MRWEATTWPSSSSSVFSSFTSQATARQEPGQEPGQELGQEPDQEASQELGQEPGLGPKGPNGPRFKIFFPNLAFFNLRNLYIRYMATVFLFGHKELT